MFFLRKQYFKKCKKILKKFKCQFRKINEFIIQKKKTFIYILVLYIRIDVEIFSVQIKFFEELKQSLKINVKLTDLKKQIENSTHFGAPERIC